MKEKLDQLHQRLTGTVLGSEDASFLLLVGLLANGHVLIQGPPGVGKTSLASTLSQSLAVRFKRVQFTPDLLPSDLVGYSLYHQGKQQFEFLPGPVFSNILLADEINRTSPRIQSALLECMNEQQVTIDGVTHALASPFLVVATQNDLYATGTFPLPEPQLDRFLLSIPMQLPKPEVQARILELHAGGSLRRELTPILSAEDVVVLQEAVRSVRVDPSVCQYITAVCEIARTHKDLWKGLSARASIALMRAAQAAALLHGHGAVFPDDVKKVALPVLGHRLATREVGGGQDGNVAAQVEEVLRHTPVP